MGKKYNRRSQSAATIPIALSIAGSDSSAGAGIQADLKTVSSLGVYGLTAVTCMVAEVPGKVSRIESASAKIVREQIDVLLRNFQIGAIKTGLLCSADIISTVAKALRDVRVPLVVDPVIVATSGDPLLEPAAIEAYEKQLFPLAGLITPNIGEAERLLRRKIKDRRAMYRAGKELERKFVTTILLKGGHLIGDHAIDLLFANGKVTEFSEPFVRGLETHGTGCTYSAAITAGIASGLSLGGAIKQAKKFVTQSISRHFQWRSKTGKSLYALRHSS